MCVWIRYGLLVSCFVLMAPDLCADEASGRKAQSPATIAMAERLERLRMDSNPLNNPFMNRERIAIVKKQRDATLAKLDSPDAFQRLMKLQLAYGLELIRAGENNSAISELERLRAMIGVRSEDNSSNLDLVNYYLALAWLRLGEVENCLAEHTPDSCHIPIKEGGYHGLPRGSINARKFLQAGLKTRPDDSRLRWLLNLAAMTLNQWPNEVDEDWRIPPAAFSSDQPFPRFKDIAGAVDLDLFSLAGGVVIDDFDGDGFFDLMVSAWGLDDPIRVFLNRAEQGFIDVTQHSGLEGIVGGLNMVQGDYDNDGLVDVLVLRGAWFGASGHHPNSLLRNIGNGQFEDVTVKANVDSEHPTQTAAWLDFDNDGWLDLFVGNESTPGDPNPSELFRNQGNGTFKEVSQSYGCDITAYTKGVVAADFDNDGWTDLYLSNRGQPNQLLRNDFKSNRKFVDVTDVAGVGHPIYSFPTLAFDYNNDGWIDLFAAGFAIKNVGDVALDYLGQQHSGQRSKLFQNQGNGRFKDVSASHGLDRLLLAMSANFGDLNNDGYLDFFLGTGDPDLSVVIPNRLFLNRGGDGFADVTTEGGFGHVQKGHGIAFADLDRDGDLDIYTSIGGAYSGDAYWNALYENPGFEEQQWLSVELIGVDSNRSGIGARLELRLRESSGKLSKLFRTVGSGGSFGASPLSQTIGYGQGARLESLQVYWPATGKTQIFDKLESQKHYRVYEDRNRLEVRELPSFDFPETSKSHSHRHP